MPLAILVQEVHLETVGPPVKVSPVPSVRQRTARESPEIFRTVSLAPQMLLRVPVL